MVRFDYDNKEIIHDRKRFSLRDFKLYLLENFEELCMRSRIRGWTFDWETILFHTRKYFIVNIYLTNLIKNHHGKTKKKTEKNKN
jgi:hypothetical protein